MRRLLDVRRLLEGGTYFSVYPRVRHLLGGGPALIRGNTVIEASPRV